MKSDSKEIHLQGVPVSRGIAIGKIFMFMSKETAIPTFQINPNDVEAEISRYHRALSYASKEIETLQEQLKKDNILEGYAIMDSHLQILKDPLLTDHIDAEIRSRCVNVESIFQSTITEYLRLFAKNADPFFQERCSDFQDVCKRVLRCLQEDLKVSLSEAPVNSLVFSRELNPSDAAEADMSKVLAFVTDVGGATSHMAILAKAKGIPYVSGIQVKKLKEFANETAIVDGSTGSIFLNPNSETLKKYLILKDTERSCQGGSEIIQLPAETYDGYLVRLYANVDNVAETELLHQYGADGIGLYRSECAFWSHEYFPSEEEQYKAYHAVVEAMNGRPVVIRTFDIGGDKQMFGAEIAYEDNSVMGRRAIRFFLHEKSVFKNQLRAILRASRHGDVSILFPMISSLSELLEAKALLSEAEGELRSLGMTFDYRVRVGCMIEVPSAAVIVDLLAKECDFLSIGTNDLVQYTLAVDRTNSLVCGLYAPAHPSVIRLIRTIVLEADNAGIPVTLCGEIAADPKFTALLLGLGIHGLSVAPRFIPAIKAIIRSTGIVEATAFAEKVLSSSNSNHVDSAVG